MKFRTAFAATAACLLFASLAQAQTYYADRGSFQAANPGLDLETFDNGTVTPGAVCGGPAPWDSAGGAPCFSAGDLLGGVVYDVQGGVSTDLVALGTGIIGNTSPVVGPNAFDDDLILTFSNPANDAVAFDVFCQGASVSIDLFGAGGLIDTHVLACNSATPTFFGVNAGEAITSIETSASGEIIEDLEFSAEAGGDAEPRATFAVWKDFDDDNPAEVLVTLNCNTGLPLTQSKLITDNDANAPAQFDGFFVGDPPVNFVVVDFEDGAMTCNITEEEVDGYEVDYFDGATNSDTSCEFVGVAYGEANTCQITNSLLEVDIEVSKVWIDENPQFDAQNIAEATWSCTNLGFGGSDSGNLDFFGNPATDEFSVYPSWNGGTICSITETTVADGGVEIDDSDCASIVVFPGSGGSCTIFNTRLYEGIPTLSQYGLAVLALLMLGIGFVAFRRIV